MLCVNSIKFYSNVTFIIIKSIIFFIIKQIFMNAKDLYNYITNYIFLLVEDKKDERKKT